jgi:lysozyme
MARKSISDLIKQLEGFRNQAYQDGGGVWTIGYGSTGPSISKGLVWSVTQATVALDTTIDKLQKNIVSMTTRKLTLNQLDALTSFCYNLGLGAYGKSTLKKCIEAGHLNDAAKEFLKWDHDNGKQVPGLTNRRQIEKKLFETP